MKTITALAEYAALTPEQYGPVALFEFSQQQVLEGGIKQCLDVVLYRKDGFEGAKLGISFTDINMLKVSFDGLSLEQLYLQINKTDFGFEVVDLDRQVSFYCEQFKVYLIKTNEVSLVN